MTPELEALAQRLEEAEKQIAHLTALVAGQSDADRTVVAKQFVVRDAQGVRRAELGMAEGDPRLGLTFGPWLGLFDANGVASVSVTAVEAGPAVCLFDTKNADRNTTARIQLDDGEPLLLCVKDGKILWSAP